MFNPLDWLSKRELAWFAVVMDLKALFVGAARHLAAVCIPGINIFISLASPSLCLLALAAQHPAVVPSAELAAAHFLDS